jgi:transposase
MKGLSIPEYRVLALWLRGHSYAVIAREEEVSPQTASRWVGKARHKMAQLMGYDGQLEDVWAMDNAEEVLEVANKLRLTTMLQGSADKRSAQAARKRDEARRARQV